MFSLLCISQWLFCVSLSLVCNSKIEDKILRNITMFDSYLWIVPHCAFTVKETWRLSYNTHLHFLKVSLEKAAGRRLWAAEHKLRNVHQNSKFVVAVLLCRLMSITRCSRTLDLALCIFFGIRNNACECCLCRHGYRPNKRSFRIMHHDFKLCLPKM